MFVILIFDLEMAARIMTHATENR